MRESPSDLSEDALRAALVPEYGLEVNDLEFLPVGHDAYAWAYRAQDSGGETYFLKVRRGVVNEPGLLIPDYLQSSGIDAVIAPLPARSGRLWAEMRSFTLVLYPFVAGESGADAGMTPEQWIEYGAILRRIHEISLPPDLARQMRRETFVPEGAALIRQVSAHLEGWNGSDPVERSTAEFWRERREQVHLLANRAEELGRDLAANPPPFLLCHADIHTANLLIDDAGKVWVVDWDEAVLAPRERDLMFVAGGGISDQWVGRKDEVHFFQGYGPVVLDPLALAYYRYAWAASDVGAYGTQVFLRPDLGSIDRRESAQILMGLFRQGEIVEKALASPRGH